MRAKHAVLTKNSHLPRFFLAKQASLTGIVRTMIADSASSNTSKMHQAPFLSKKDKRRRFSSISQCPFAFIKDSVPLCQLDTTQNAYCRIHTIQPNASLVLSLFSVECPIFSSFLSTSAADKQILLPSTHRLPSYFAEVCQTPSSLSKACQMPPQLSSTHPP